MKLHWINYSYILGSEQESGNLDGENISDDEVQLIKGVTISKKNKNHKEKKTKLSPEELQKKLKLEEVEIFNLWNLIMKSNYNIILYIYMYMYNKPETHNHLQIQVEKVSQA